jgi:hypothetical protein
MHDPRNSTALRQLANHGTDPDPPRWLWGVVRPDPEGRLRLPAEARRALRFRPAHRHQVRGICHRVALVVRVEGPGAALVVDILVHTWDLARAAGLDETLDPEVTHDMLVGLEPLDEVLRASGQYGPKVAVADTADDQTKLLAFTGRKP